jgi:oligosaccharide repeat unit polymerase
MRKFAEPGILFGIWILFILGNSCVCFPKEVNCESILFILVCILAALFGSLLSHLFELEVKLKADIWIPSGRTLWLLFICTSIFWAIAHLMSLLPLIRLFDISDPSQTKNLATEAFTLREGEVLSSEAVSSAIIGLVLYIIGIPSLFFGAILAARAKIIGFLPLLMGSINSLISFSRFHLFIYVLLFAYSYLCIKTEYFKKNFLAVRTIVMTIIVSLLVFFIIGYVRNGPNENLYDAFITYVFGGLAAFCQWFGASKWSVLGDFNGRTMYALASWFAKLGYSSPPSPLHLEPTMIGDSLTNVYSIFRLLVEDYGVIVTPIIFMVFGFVGGILTRLCIAKKSFPYVPVVAFMWLFAFSSFYTSITVDTRIMFGCLFSSFLLFAYRQSECLTPFMKKSSACRSSCSQKK